MKLPAIGPTSFDVNIENGANAGGASVAMENRGQRGRDLSLGKESLATL